MTSKIEWTDRTWDPVEGCRRKSPGCDQCWAVQLIGTRFKHLPNYQGLVADGQFTGKVVLRHDRLNEPIGARTAARWFVCSRSDLFGAQVPDAYIAAVWCRAYWTSGLSAAEGRRVRRRRGGPVQTFQVLTKRERRLEAWTNGWADPAQRKGWISEAHQRGWCDSTDLDYADLMPAAMPNIWLGVSVESQEYADARIPALLRSPAAVRWVSAEPLLGPVDLDRWIWGDRCPDRQCDDSTWDHDCRLGEQRLHWVVVGGETARHRRSARSMHPDWARLLRDQCTAAGVGFFFKQWGDWAPIDQFDTVGYDDVAWTDNAAVTMWPDGRLAAGALGQFMDRSEVLWPVGKKAAGHMLDEAEWLEAPRGVAA